MFPAFSALTFDWESFMYGTASITLILYDQFLWNHQELICSEQVLILICHILCSSKAFINHTSRQAVVVSLITPPSTERCLSIKTSIYDWIGLQHNERFLKSPPSLSFLTHFLKLHRRLWISELQSSSPIRHFATSFLSRVLGQICSTDKVAKGNLYRSQNINQ